MLHELTPEPKIVDWYAIDLLAFGRRSEQNICPLCGQSKRVNFICETCMQRYGQNGLNLVRIEVGIRNWRHWYDLVGKNLKFIAKNGKKPAEKPRSVVEIPTQLEAQSEHVVFSIDCLAAAENDDGQADPNCQAKRDLPEAKKSEFKTSFLVEQIDLGGGIKIWSDVAQKMAVGWIWERTKCPICRNQKEIAHWLCGDCLKQQGFYTITLIKNYLSQFNPRIVVRKIHIPDHTERVELLQKFKEIINKDFQDDFLHHPNMLIQILKSRDSFSDAIPWPILFEICQKALQTKRKEIGEKTEKWILRRVQSLMGKKTWKGPYELTDELFYSEKLPIGYKDLLKVAKQVFLEEKAELSGKAFCREIEAIKNLRENVILAEAFLAFLHNSFATWKIEREIVGKSGSLKAFSHKIGYSETSWRAFQKNPSLAGISISKAKQISANLGCSVYKALEFGKTLLDVN